MTTKKMTSERLLELSAAYGADPNRWPDNERDAATTFMDAKPKVARNVMDDAQSLDHLLDGGKKDVTNTDFLAARILKAAQELDGVENPANDMVRGPAHLPKRQPAWRSIAATLVITTGIGFAMGQSAAAKSARIAEAETLLSLTLDNPFDSSDIWEDL